MLVSGSMKKKSVGSRFYVLITIDDYCPYSQVILSAWSQVYEDLRERLGNGEKSTRYELKYLRLGNIREQNAKLFQSSN